MSCPHISAGVSISPRAQGENQRNLLLGFSSVFLGTGSVNGSSAATVGQEAAEGRILGFPGLMCQPY